MIRAPRSTYRLQLQPAFGFRDAARIVPYLRRLGVSELYLSPVFKAAPGSTHGYDVIDHDQLNPELGGEAGFSELSKEASANALGITVDFVPNHMGVGCDGNRYWDDVLKHGRASRFSSYFDIDWHSPKTTLEGKLLLPILPDQFGVCLEAGKLVLSWDGTGFRFLVSDRRLPLRPKSLGLVLDALSREVGADSPGLASALRTLGEQFRALEEPDGGDGRDEYVTKVEGLEYELLRVAGSGDGDAAIQAALCRLNGNVGDAHSFDFLDSILREQVYRLSSAQLALEAINYRRFFAVDELAAVRVELPEVYEAAHRKLFELVKQGAVTGIRLDHIDGLYDPIGYLQQLNRSLREATDKQVGGAPLHVTVEKILAPDEQLPSDFVTDGTTGYEFIRVMTGVFVDQRAATSITSFYRRFTGDRASFADHLKRSKRDILDSILASDITMISHELERLAELDRRSRDFSWRSLHEALLNVMVSFAPYRTYVRPDGSCRTEDRTIINRAVADAMATNPVAGRGPYQFIRSLLLGESDLPGASHFGMRFQQATGPVTAKSLEDTAFYRYARFVAENEVGGRPDDIGVELAAFHDQNTRRAERSPWSLVTSSTHDTKRGEDVRARLSMISELPNTWRSLVLELDRHTRAMRASGADAAPARVDQYLYYQTLIGVVPFGAADADFSALEERIQAYMLKACREAKANTSWLHPNEPYEKAVSAFIRQSLGSESFVRAVRRFCSRIETHAACKALGQVALKLCSPGVPDTYQGSEVWHQVLVDPDNRRPVPYEGLTRMLEILDSKRADRPPLLKELLDTFQNGSVKMFVVSELLRLRNEQPDLFDLPYHPLDAGPNCVAFARGEPRARLVCIVPRFPFRITRGRTPWPLRETWGGERVAGTGLVGVYRNVFTGALHTLSREASLAEVFAEFPVCVLVSFTA